ncbi:MAG: hypothetical protein PHC61_09260 [Chitinivibrionales bacterium]|nr:hypothetical protein [Chitinivibrionales bacterium]
MKNNLKQLSFGIGLLILFTHSVSALWTKVGPMNDFVYSLAISGNNIFAGTGGSGAGIYLSTDNGTIWTQVNNGITNNTYTSIGDIRALAASTYGIFAGTVVGAGVYLSTNNGINWNPGNNGLTNRLVYSLAVSGSNVFAGGPAGVFLSTNNGVSWTQVSSGIPYIYGTTYDEVYSLAISGKSIFAGTVLDGVYLSSNNGTNWNSANSGLTNKGIMSLAVKGNNIFAGASDAGGGSIFLSTNNGANWNSIFSNSKAYTYALAVSGNNIFAGVTGSGVFLSTDNGTSWTSVSDGLTNTNIWSLASSDKNIFAGTDGGLWRRPLSEMVAVKYHVSLNQAAKNIKIIRTDYFNFSGQKLPIRDNKPVAPANAFIIKRNIDVNGIAYASKITAK